MLTTSISKIHTRFWVLQLTRQLHSVRVRILRNIRINNFWTSARSWTGNMNMESQTRFEDQSTDRSNIDVVV